MDRLISNDAESWKWTRESIWFFLGCIEKRKLELRNPKIKKNDVWKGVKNKMISNGFENIDELGVERKFRNMKATYKTIKENLKKSEKRKEVTWEYFEAMESIFEEDETNAHTISSFLRSSRSICVASTPVYATSTSVGVNISSSTDGNEVQFSSVGGLVVPVSEIIELESEFDNTEEPMHTSPLPSPNLSISSMPPVNLEQVTVKPGNLLKAKKQNVRRRQLYDGLRKKEIKVGESKVKELKLLREAIEENNRIQRERNDLLMLFLEKGPAESPNRRKLGGMKWASVIL